MKKIFYSMLALFLTASAFTLTSCEDVPAPYDQPNTENGGGEVIPTEPAGDGTQASPFNIAKVLEEAKKLSDGQQSESDVYFKGIVTQIKENYNGGFGNATYYVSDDAKGSNQFYVYRSLYYGNKKYTSGDLLNVGDTVVVCGKLTNYGGTLETQQNASYLYSVNGKTENGGGGDNPGQGGEGSENNPYSVTDALSKGEAAGSYVKGFIVGYVDGKSLSEGAKFAVEGCNVNTNVLIAASADETELSKCMPVQLPSGAVRSGLNLQDNPGLYKKEVVLYGDITKYFGATGLKNVSYAKAEGKEIGTKPSAGGETGAAYLNESFASSQGNFVIKDVSLGELSFVWKHDASYHQMKASAYMNSTNHAAESWLVSPAIDLTRAATATLTFDQALNFLKSDKLADHVQVLVSTDYAGDVKAATWTQLTVSTLPSGSDWTFVTSTADMKAFAGKKVYLAFRYVSTASVAPTWEIKNVVVK